MAIDGTDAANSNIPGQNMAIDGTAVGDVTNNNISGQNVKGAYKIIEKFPGDKTIPTHVKGPDSNFVIIGKIDINENCIRKYIIKEYHTGPLNMNEMDIDIFR